MIAVQWPLKLKSQGNRAALMFLSYALLAGFPGVTNFTKEELGHRCEAVTEVLGGREQATALILHQPKLLRLAPRTLRANVAYLRQELGWSTECIAEFASAEPGTFQMDLAAPAMQHLLAQCERVLSLPPAAMLERHASSLRCSPEAAVMRVAFVEALRLQPRIRTPAFLQTPSPRWSNRMHLWGMADQWAAFAAAYWQSEEGAALQQQMEAWKAEKKAAANTAKSTAVAAAWAAGRHAGNRWRRRCASKN